MFEVICTPMLTDRFSTSDVLQLTGVTARQLQWWDEKRVVVPEREGRNRICIDPQTQLRAREASPLA